MFCFTSSWNGSSTLRSVSMRRCNRQTHRVRQSFSIRTVEWNKMFSFGEGKGERESRDALSLYLVDCLSLLMGCGISIWCFSVCLFMF